MKMSVVQTTPFTALFAVVGLLLGTTITHNMTEFSTGVTLAVELWRL